MEKNTPKQKKAYAPPKVTRHGDAVTMTMASSLYGAAETFSPGAADWH